MCFLYLRMNLFNFNFSLFKVHITWRVSHFASLKKYQREGKKNRKNYIITCTTTHTNTQGMVLIRLQGWGESGEIMMNR